MNINPLGNSMNIQSQDSFRTNRPDDVSFENALKKAYDEKDKESLQKACNEFENILTSMMYKQMQSTITSTSLTEKSYGREIFEDMLDDEMINGFGANGIGIAEILYKDLSKKLDNTFTPASVAIEKIENK